MKPNEELRSGWVLAIAVALALVIAPAVAAIQEHPEHPEQAEHPAEPEHPEHPTGDAMMAMMAEMAAPNEHHAHMAKMAGSWKASGKFWMQPGAEPVTSEGTAKIEPILGGRFMRINYKGQFMGMDFEGMGLDGYDKMKKKHTGLWVDNMGTWMMTYEGDCSDDHKVTTTVSQFQDPMSGGNMKMKAVTTVVDNDKFRYEAYMMLPDGNSFKTMEIHYKRQ